MDCMTCLEPAYLTYLDALFSAADAHLYEIDPSRLRVAADRLRAFAPKHPLADALDDKARRGGGVSVIDSVPRGILVH